MDITNKGEYTDLSMYRTFLGTSGSRCDLYSYKSSSLKSWDPIFKVVKSICSIGDGFLIAMCYQTSSYELETELMQDLFMDLWGVDTQIFGNLGTDLTWKSICINQVPVTAYQYKEGEEGYEYLIFPVPHAISSSETGESVKNLTEKQIISRLGGFMTDAEIN